MTKEEFKPYFDVFPKGNYDKCWINMQYAHHKDKIPFELVTSKWKEYIENCQANKTSDQYIVSLEKFIEKQMYNTNFKVTLQLGFLNKYKKK